jgi:hypothetical protein
VQERLLDLFLNETLNCKRYVQVIFGQIFPELTEEERLYGWFQQDSVTADTARMSMQVCLMFSGTEISTIMFT